MLPLYVTDAFLHNVLETKLKNSVTRNIYLLEFRVVTYSMIFLK